MYIQPRVKTQYPKTQDIQVEEITPIPIETVFFLDDEQQDINHLNRYYFNYPGNWAKVNNGENIIGLKTIKVHINNFNLDFTLKLVKYDWMIFYEYEQDTFDETIKYLIQKDIDLAKTNELDIIYSIKRNELDYDNFFRCSS